METQRGSSSFNMRLVRVSIDGDDDPIGREATLRLRTQHDQSTLHKTDRRLMEIHIDGRLRACWDFSLLEQHPSYHIIHIFSSFAMGKRINMTLPLPLGSRSALEQNPDCLKAIRVYFSKSQDFHTAINWLSKHAHLIHLNGRPATSNALHTFDTRIRPTGADACPPMAPHTQPPVSHDHGQVQSRPQSRPQSRGGPTSPPQLLRQLGARRQSRGLPQPMAHGLRGHRDASDLRRNVFDLQEIDRPATTLPSVGRYRSNVTNAGHAQMPSITRAHTSKTTSISRMGDILRPIYGTNNEKASFSSNVLPPAGLDPPSGRQSPHSLPAYQRDLPSHEPSKTLSPESHVSDSQYFSLHTLGPDRRAPSQLSQSNTLAVTHNQSPAAASSVDIPDPYTSGFDYVAQRRRVVSVAQPGVMLHVDHPSQMNLQSQSTMSSQKERVPSIYQASLQSNLDGFETPPAILSVAGTRESQHALGQDLKIDPESSFPRPPSASLKRQLPTETQGPRTGKSQAASQHPSKEKEPNKRQGQARGLSRPTSAQHSTTSKEKKRKANQSAVIRRATRRTVRDNGVDDGATVAFEESQTESVPPAVVASSLDQAPSSMRMPMCKDTQMMDHATQTDHPTRLQVDVLHLAAALELNQRLLQEAGQWESTENHEERLLRLGAQFVQGLRGVFAVG